MDCAAIIRWIDLHLSRLMIGGDPVYEVLLKG